MNIHRESTHNFQNAVNEGAMRVSPPAVSELNLEATPC
jgi:hypothetical protein